jgi:phage repressor protein C with HTH and peptisase S24 domain
MSNETILLQVFETLRSEKKVKNQDAFAKDLKLTPSYISRLLKSNDILPKEVMATINKVYGVSLEWLASNGAEGSMFDMAVKQSSSKEVIEFGKQSALRLNAKDYAAAFGDWQGVPMYNAVVTASFIDTYRDDRIFHPSYYLHDPRFRDCDFGAIITGDSMHSEIRHGDHVICKQIEDRRFIVFGDIYYIISTNGLETCKYVNADPVDKNNLLLVPRNEAISASPIPKDMILKMYKVRGIIRGY